MTILEWKESDYDSPEEFQAVFQGGAGGHNYSASTDDAQHRARQRLFHYKCLHTLKQQGQHWTLLMDTHEFVFINYQIAREYNLTDHLLLQPPSQPGSVAHFVHEHARMLPNSLPKINQLGASFSLQSSPCVQIPRIRFGAKESNESEIQQRVPLGYHGSDFLTLRWRYHTFAQDDYQDNKLPMTIVDLSRIDLTEIIVPVNSTLNRPIQQNFCPALQDGPGVHPSQSLLLIHDYSLGSLKQYFYRQTLNNTLIDDQVRSLLYGFKNQSAWASQQTDDDDEIRRWLEGFDQNPPKPRVSTTQQEHLNRATSQQLLEGVGELQPKSWTTYEGDPKQERCAMCFFGLPRAYKTMVLPSIVKNLLIPNARHNCDVYVHFSVAYGEAPGRMNPGGVIDPYEIYLLETAVKDVQVKYGPSHGARTHRIPTVAFVNDTEAEFQEKRGAILAKYKTKTDPDDGGRLMYFPYKEKTWHNASLDNVVKQWHSIETAFQLMEITGRQLGVEYSRVGMFRSDVLFVKPIDMAMLGQDAFDSQNRFVVVPGFAQYPVNDRMIYGNVEGVKIWATSRFSLIEERAKAHVQPGYVMHSERFMSSSVFQAIKTAGYPVITSKDICFIRTRADESARWGDCLPEVYRKGPRRRQFARQEAVNVQALVEGIVQRNCSHTKDSIFCREGVREHRLKAGL